jgi:hypothetical protein
MDEFDPEIQNTLKCDVEIYVQSGRTYREILAKTALALRNVATQLESGWLEDGFHPIKTRSGEEIGEVYVDYSGIMGG